LDEDYVERVLAAVEQIPPGRVASYGDIAELVGWGGPRRVGQVMARHGAAVAWWRVVRSDGRPAAHLEAEALATLAAESAPIAGDRVEMRRARFRFGAESSDSDGGRGSQSR
jgi:alkylated DNA nucleotide flippase Atl1